MRENNGNRLSAGLLTGALFILASCATVSPPVQSAPTPGAIPVVIVPGVTGSRLCDSEGRVLWGDVPRLIVPWDGGYSMALPITGADDGVVPCGPIREMRIGHYRKDIYGGLLDFLIAAGHPAHFFDYDWRRDNVESARQLVSELERIGSDRVALICQSNATYICRWAAMYGDVSLEEAEEGIRRPAGVLIEKLIMVGTANGGSIRILQELNRGRQYIRIIGRHMRPETLFTFRSLHQDLPVYRDDLFFSPDGTPLPIDVFALEPWLVHGWSIFADGPAARAPENEVFGTSSQREAFLRDSLDRARRLQALLRRGTERSPTRYYSIQSRELPTPSHAVVEGRSTRIYSALPGDRHAVEESQEWLSPAERTALLPPFVVPGKHFEMITTDETRQIILEMLRE